MDKLKKKLKKELKKKLKKKLNLPKKIISISNADKKWHEKWESGRYLLNLPHPHRAVICSLPNCGKTCTVKNILIRQDPPFKKLFVIHIDGNWTEEYDDVEPTKFLDSIPPPDSYLFDGKTKTAVILEDLEYKFMNRRELKNLDMLMGYVSTHKNVSVYVLTQDFYNLPVSVRRMANVWILGKYHDIESLNMISRKCNIENFKELFAEHVQGVHDYLWIDNTKDSPAPLRKNGYQLI